MTYKNNSHRYIYIKLSYFELIEKPNEDQPIISKQLQNK